MNWENDETYLSRWLNDELNAQEKEAFENSPEGKEFIALIKASEDLRMSDYNVDSALDGLRDKIDNHEAPKQKQIWFNPIFQIGSAAAVLIIAFFVFLYPDGDTSVVTAFGQQEVVNLPDGSTVRLNANSQLSYDEDEFLNDRLLKLEGEAFFEVEKGSKFQVNTDIGTIQVLGTSFNVKSRPEQFEVLCFTGKVQVDASSQTTILTKGLSAVLKNNTLETSNHTGESEPGWLKGIITLNDVSVQTALSELTNQFGIEITVEAPMNQMQYTGSFPTSNAKSAVSLVLDPLNISYTYNHQEKSLVIHGINE
ncbi:MAG: FecR family protein [bacterium]|nr:FecR family protein [bacterium]